MKFLVSRGYGTRSVPATWWGITGLFVWLGNIADRVDRGGANRCCQIRAHEVVAQSLLEGLLEFARNAIVALSVIAIQLLINPPRPEFSQPVQ